MLNAFLFITYQLSHIILAPLIPLVLLIRALKGKPTFGSWRERLGLVPPAPAKKVLWFHAVSVGEILAAEHLMRTMRARIPGAHCYLTVGTITGKKIAQSKGIADTISLLPFDLLPCVLAAFKRINPQHLIIIEGDFWPNLLSIARYKNIPITCLNARIRPQVMPRNRWLGVLMRPLLNCISQFYVQSTGDKERFESLGVRADKLHVLGNIKSFNVLEKQQELQAAGEKMLHDPVVLAGSLHPGELKIVLDSFRHARIKTQNLKLIIAPRHFHWKGELLKTVTEYGYSYALWDESSPLTSIEDALSNHDIILVCVLGELFNLYRYASIYILGGTFVPIGGHNLYEPAVWSVATIIGPHHETCTAVATELRAHHALLIAQNDRELTAHLEMLLENNPLRTSMGAAARRAIANEAHAVKRGLAALTERVNVF